ncbi:trafficking protein particle complex subunit 1-like [Oppia nitens]|uniref:trafficking protein particle complex subunit 1-like n=1 Tax=Oppia nitens TaxID=1686743 RepID=UPI0023DB027E|nr:trafficking protein particle complex subunit 1-like [Oppia nitens]
MIYNFYIFDGNGLCRFTLNGGGGGGSGNSGGDQQSDNNTEDQTRLLYGFLYSLKSFGQRIGPVLVKDNNFLTYSTNAYQLILLEMATSVKFVLVVSPDSTKNNEYYKQLLRDMYRTVYVEYYVKNGIKSSSSASSSSSAATTTLPSVDTTIDSQLFRDKIVEFFNKL